MAKSHVKASKVLEPAIERLVARSGAALELSYIQMVLGVRGANDSLLSTVALVSDALLAGRDFGLQALAKDLDIGISSWKRTVHPNKAIMEDGESKLIVYAGLIELVGVKLRVLG